MSQSEKPKGEGTNVVSASAIRMRRYRLRKRKQFRHVSLEIKESEINAFISEGLLKAEERGSDAAVRCAIYRHLSRTLKVTA